MNVINGFTVSAAIVTYNDGEKAKRALLSLKENTKKYPLEVSVIDNASTDNTLSEVKPVEGISVVENKRNIGFGAAHNKVISTLSSKYHFVVNPDITLKDDVISDMVDFMEQNPDVVMMMPKILNTDGTEQYLPKEIPTFKRLFLGRLIKGVREEFIWKDKALESVCDVDFCTGCFFVIRSDLFRELGGFDKRYFMYLEDADLTLRAKKYGRVVMNRNISVYHDWERVSAKNLKYLIIHTSSAFKFLFRKGKLLK